MRISDWTSDVCSSDLADQLDADEGEHGDLEAGEETAHPLREEPAVIPQIGHRSLVPRRRFETPGNQREAGHDQRDDRDDLDQREPELHLAEQFYRDRTDEHTSELPSLMRISYAV